MNAAHTLDLSHLLNEVDTQIDPFLLLIFGPGEAPDNVVWDMHAGNIFADPLGGLCRGEGADSGQYKGLFQ